MLNVNDRAADFELKDQNGATVTLDALLANGNLILYFYPVDFSPVCTAQACAFRDNYAGLEAIGTQVVGISPQSFSSHQRFARSFSVPFPLLSDSDKKTIRAYGVDGPLGFGVRRATFLIDSEKIVRNRVVADLFLDSHTQLIRKTIESSASE